VGAKFSAPFQTGSEAHPTSYTMGIGSLPGVKRPERGVDHSPISSAEVKERVELYIYFPSGPTWPVLGELYLYFTFCPLTLAHLFHILFLKFHSQFPLLLFY
jgi:hypothetical protein